MDPRTRLLLLAAVSLLAVLFEGPVALGLLALAAAAGFTSLPLAWRWRWRALGLVAVIVWSTVLSQGLFYAAQPRVAWLSLGPIAFYGEGARHGLIQSLRLVAVGLAGVAVAVGTPPDRLFAALTALRVPWSLGFLAVTALRFVPVMGREALIVRQARARRGRPLSPRRPLAWLRQEVALLLPVVARSLRRAHALAETLDARGFDPVAPRTHSVALRFARWEPPLLALVGATVLAIAASRLLFALYVAEVWYHPGWRDFYGFVRDWL